jgi:hypothetical protein
MAPGGSDASRRGVVLRRGAVASSEGRRGVVVEQGPGRWLRPVARRTARRERREGGVAACRPKEEERWGGK